MKIADVETAVCGFYPQAFAAKDSRLWRVYRNPAGPLAKTYLGAGITKQAAWEKALKNIKGGPQCCFPGVLDLTICDEKGNVLEVEVVRRKGQIRKVLLNVLENEDDSNSQMMITEDLKKIAAVRDTLTRILDEANANHK